MRSVLFVDDEQPLLDALKRAFRTRSDHWRQRFANGGARALAMMAEEPADVVITDARMPGVDGEALLRGVAARWPATVRVVLSGQTDPEVARRLFSVAHQFISKPCPSAELFETVERSCRAADGLEEPLRSRVLGLSRLPAMEAAHQRLGHIVANDGAGLDALVEVVASDPGLAARALQMANSGALGSTRAVVGIREAVLGLGREGLAELRSSTEPYPPEWAEATGLAQRGAARARGCEGLAQAAAVLAPLGALIAAHAGAADLAVPVAATLLGLWNLPSALIDAVAKEPR